jgi:hypothetical protein
VQENKYAVAVNEEELRVLKATPGFVLIQRFVIQVSFQNLNRSLVYFRTKKDAFNCHKSKGSIENAAFDKATVVNAEGKAVPMDAMGLWLRCRRAGELAVKHAPGRLDSGGVLYATCCKCQHQRQRPRGLAHRIDGC